MDGYLSSEALRRKRAIADGGQQESAFVPEIGGLTSTAAAVTRRMEQEKTSVNGRGLKRLWPGKCRFRSDLEPGVARLTWQKRC